MFWSTVFLITLAASFPYFFSHSASHSASDLAAFFYLESAVFARPTITRRWSPYMSPRLEILGIDGILVEPLPLLECGFGTLLILFVVPVKHVVTELQPDALAVNPQDTLGIIQQVIGINDTGFRFVDIAIRNPVCLAGNLGCDQTGFPGEIEESTQLVVSRFIRVEVVEAGHGVQRRDGAAVVRGNAGVGVADKEGEMELLQHGFRHDGGIPWLALGRVWEWGFAALVLDAVGPIDMVLAVRTIGLVVLGFRADPAPLWVQGGRNSGGLMIGRDQIIDDVLDEQTFALGDGVSTARLDRLMMPA